MKNYPDWRFNFSDDWQEKKLSENFVVRMCKRIYKEEATEFGEIPFYKIGTLGKKADSYISKQLYETYRKKYHFPDVEDTLISCSGTVGNCVIYDGKPAYFQDSNIVWLESNTDTKFDKKFLYLYLSQLNWNELSSTTIKRIYSDDLLQKILSYPCIEEQKKISDYLTHFDKALTAQEKKVTNWREVKKGMLQKIFSREFRFKDDNGNNYPDWQEKKLGDLISIPISNGVFCNPKKKGTGKKIINVINLYNDFVIDEDSLELLNIDEKEFKANQVHQGDLFFTRSSLKLEGIAHCNIYSGGDKDVTFDGHIMRVRLNNDLANSKFIMLQSMTSKIRSQMMMKAKTTTMTTIGQEELSDVKYKIPCPEEQKKIADYFSHLDKIISAESKILESMREMKKGLLQKLFV